MRHSATWSSNFRHTVVSDSLGRSLQKSVRRSDWDARPLSEEQIEYAALDANILLQLDRASVGQ